MSREGLVDPERFDLRLAAPQRRPAHWPTAVAIAAAVAVVITGTTFFLNTSGQGHRTNPPATLHTLHKLGATDAHYLRLAALQSRRILALAPLPPGARRLVGEPAGWPGGGAGMSPETTSLSHTAWYSVSMTADGVSAFLRQHTPAGMRKPGGWGRGPGDLRSTAYAVGKLADPEAYGYGSLLVQWHQSGATTFIRFDSAISARRARTPQGFLTGTVTSVLVRLTSPDRRTVRLTAAHDPGRVAMLSASFNGLYGAVRSNSLCSGPVFHNTYRVTFQTTTASMTYQAVPDCSPYVEVFRDGSRVEPNLDAGKVLTTLDRIVRDFRR